MSTDERPPTRGGFHPISIGHLVMGLVLLGLAGVWALVTGGVADHDALRWLLPIPWVVAGAVGLVATAVTGTRRHAVRPAGPPGWVGGDGRDPASPDQPEPQQPDQPLPPDDDEETP